VVKRTNYKQEKRLKELEKQKKKKKEAKKERKTGKPQPIEDGFESNDAGEIVSDEKQG